MSHSINLNTKMHVDSDFLSDILTIAVEGGINYWCALDKVVRDEDLSVLSFAGHDHEDESETFECTFTKVCKALESIVNGDNFPELTKYIMEHDASNIDAEGADAIIQVALFDEIVYG